MFTEPNVKTNNISTLDPQPNDVGGLSALQLQALFDKFGVDFIAYFIETHLTELASTTDGSSGADGIGVPEKIAGSGANVKARLEWIYDQLSNITLNEIPDRTITASKIAVGSITTTELSFDPATQDELNTHTGTDATESAKGHVEFATVAETATGTDNTKAVHPKGLKTELDKKVNLSTLSAQGSIPYASGAGAWTELLKGTAFKTLGMNALANAPQWQDSLQSLIVAAGDLIIGVGANAPARLAKDIDGKILTLVSGLPAWSSVPHASGQWSASNSPSIAIGATYTKTIPIGIVGKRGRAILQGYTGGYPGAGCIVHFDTVQAHSLAIVSQGSSGSVTTINQDGNLANGMFSTGSPSYVKLQNCYIDGTNIVFVFKNTSMDTTQTLSVANCLWEVEG